MRIGNLTEGKGVTQSSNLMVCCMIFLSRWKRYCMVGLTGFSLAYCGDSLGLLASIVPGE